MNPRNVSIALVGVVVLICGLVVFIGPDKVIRKLQNTASNVSLDRSVGQAKYPAIDESQLTPTQRKIVAVTQQEFAAKPKGTKYAEGVSEPWCADFVSWVMKESGVPLKNPNSGSWRIPGTYTLLEYYKQVGRFKDITSGYTPRIGDVALYRNSPIFGDHTNIVLKNDAGVLTTVGGNENNTVRIYTNEKKNYTGLLGYGTLD